MSGDTFEFQVTVTGIVSFDAEQMASIEELAASNNISVPALLAEEGSYWWDQLSYNVDSVDVEPLDADDDDE